MSQTKEKGFSKFKEFDSFIQDSLNKFFFVEPWEKLYEATGNLHLDVISNKSTIPDLIIYNKTFNKNECFIDANINTVNKFPRMRFILRPRIHKEYNPACTYSSFDHFHDIIKDAKGKIDANEKEEKKDEVEWEKDDVSKLKDNKVQFQDIPQDVKSKALNEEGKEERSSTDGNGSKDGYEMKIFQDLVKFISPEDVENSPKVNVKKADKDYFEEMQKENNNNNSNNVMPTNELKKNSEKPKSKKKKNKGGKNKSNKENLNQMNQFNKLNTINLNQLYNNNFYNSQINPLLNQGLKQNINQLNNMQNIDEFKLRLLQQNQINQKILQNFQMQNIKNQYNNMQPNLAMQQQGNMNKLNNFLLNNLQQNLLYNNALSNLNQMNNNLTLQNYNMLMNNAASPNLQNLINMQNLNNLQLLQQNLQVQKVAAKLRSQSQTGLNLFKNANTNSELYLKNQKQDIPLNNENPNSSKRYSEQNMSNISNLLENLSINSKNNKNEDPLMKDFSHDVKAYNPCVYFENPALLVKNNLFEKKWFVMKDGEIVGNYTSEELYNYLDKNNNENKEFFNLNITVNDYHTDIVFKPKIIYDILKENLNLLKKNYLESQIWKNTK